MNRCIVRVSLLLLVVALIGMSVTTTAQNQPKRLVLEEVKAAGDDQEENRWAVIIGAGSFKSNGIAALEYPVSDATEISKALEEHCGFPKDHIRLLINEQATVQNIRNVLGNWLVKVAKPRDIVVVYFSGHGTPDLDSNVADGGVRTYLVCHDTAADNLFTSALALDDMQAALQRLQSERTLILLDSCYSGAAPPPGNIGAVKTVPHKIAGGRPKDGSISSLATSGRGRVVLTACAPDEESWEYPEFKHGIFTYFVLEGLRGKAAINGRLTPSRLSEYVREQVSAESRKRHVQTPYGYASISGAEFSLIKAGGGATAQGQGTVSLTSSPLGASILVDGKPKGKTPAKIAVPSGEHQVVLYKEGFQPYQTDIVVSAGKTTYDSGLLPLADTSGSVLLLAPPRATVQIDNQDRGTVEDDGHLLLANLKLESHLRVTAQGYDPYDVTLEVAPSQLITRRIVLKPSIPGKHDPKETDIIAGLNRVGAKFVWEKDQEEMVFVSEGEFIMGSNDLASSNPQRTLTLPAFWIDKTEVTNAQFAEFVSKSGYRVKGEWAPQPKEKDRFPAVRVTLEDARAYAKWAGKMIPTEEQWEKAARSTDGRTYPYGNEYNPKYQLTHATTSLDEPVSVGYFPDGASPYGALDMLGNAAEWTASEYDAYPGGGRADANYGKGRYVIRGGSFRTSPNTQPFSVYARSFLLPSAGLPDVGFRCVLPVGGR